MTDEGSDVSPRCSVRIGCAGWSIPREHAALFDHTGTHLERYARRFSCVEINSSFYKPHQTSTYARWQAAVPSDFRFAVKVPREITHHLRLIKAADVLDRFLSEAAALDRKLGPLVVQLPPSLAFDETTVRGFLDMLRARFAGMVVCEPRHASWFRTEADDLLTEFKIARVAADPAVAPGAMCPGGWSGLAYYRLHGSPRVYYSAYSDEWLQRLEEDLRGISGSAPAWCIFDNTAAGSATTDALKLAQLTHPAINGAG